MSTEKAFFRPNTWDLMWKTKFLSLADLLFVDASYFYRLPTTFMMY